MSENTLFEKLKNYSASGILPMHMPGHKRSVNGTVLEKLGGKYDITEIDGFDNLAAPEGLLLDSQKKAAELWGARESFFLVNGSTQGILSSIYAAAGHGGRIIMARNCHKSVYNAVELCSISPVYITPEFDAEFGAFGSVNPQKVKKAFDENQDISLVVITSPTYEGVISDISAIAEIAHSHGALLLVDEAHGAHLGLYDVFPDGAVRCGADIVVQSLHKTLQSLTQTAVMHLCSDRTDSKTYARAVSIFGTSSPSYLLMASIDSCVKTTDRQLLKSWRKAIAENSEAFSSLVKYRVMDCNGANSAERYCLDPSKYAISASRAGMSGFELAERLRKEYKIEIEMACAGHIVAMTGAGDTADSIRRFADAMTALDREASGHQPRLFTEPPVCEKVCGAAAALGARHRLCPAENAAGKISADYIYAYPPGIPLVVPGELLSSEIIEAVTEMSSLGAQVLGTDGAVPKHFSVLDI